MKAAWELVGGKRRELVCFLYPDEAVQSDVGGVSCLRLTLALDVVGRFDGVSVCDPDGTTRVELLIIDGVRIWQGPQQIDGEGVVLEPSKPTYLHAGSVARLYMHGAFSRVLLLVQRAEEVKAAAKKEGAA
jgi:hypothetical protein